MQNFLKVIGVLTILLYGVSCKEKNNRIVPDKKQKKTIVEKDTNATNIKKRVFIDSVFEKDVLKPKKLPYYFHSSIKDIFYQGINCFDTEIRLVDKLGKPDSVILSSDECGAFVNLKENENKYQRYKYGNITFIVNHQNQAILESIDFYENEELEIKGIKVSQDTDIETFGRLFTNVTGQWRSQYSFKIYLNEKKDMWYVVYFAKGNLNRIILYTPC